MNNKKLWGGRFSETTSKVTEQISASLHFDMRLYKQDIEGSIAHARMLCKQGILSQNDCDDIIKGLKIIEKEIEEGLFPFDEKLEDIHMNIESRLTQLVGDAGKRLHTARSRNDQVVTDVRLYLKKEIKEIQQYCVTLVKSLLNKAEENMQIIMPGYTHMQIAQPVRFSHHLLVYAWAYLRDLKRLHNAFDAADVLPLGSGALAGVNYDTDRHYLAKELQFGAIAHNSMDAVSDRDFIADFLYFAAMIGMHSSRLAEDLIMWSTAEFNFIRLSDSVTTGSSIMPQKRNPDVAELIRGKTGRLYGNLFALFTILKGLPMTYNRDLQEDKEPLFDSVDTVKLVIKGMDEMIKHMTVNGEITKKAVYKNYSTATDVADYLVMRGIPFRQAHEIVGTIVKHCEQNKKDFFALTLDELKTFSDKFDRDIYEYLDPQKSTERKKSYGSTSIENIENQIKLLKEKLNEYCH
ncbi:MAG: argininosuccinate lyase [Spirochaetes bacterium]|nr:argininosuccinate lyase [Spirochaetota bacterium]